MSPGLYGSTVEWTSQGLYGSIVEWTSQGLYGSTVEWMSQGLYESIVEWMSQGLGGSIAEWVFQGLYGNTVKLVSKGFEVLLFKIWLQWVFRGLDGTAVVSGLVSEWFWVLMLCQSWLHWVARVWKAVCFQVGYSEWPEFGRRRSLKFVTMCGPWFGRKFVVSELETMVWKEVLFQILVQWVSQDLKLLFFIVGHSECPRV